MLHLIYPPQLGDKGLAYKLFALYLSNIYLESFTGSTKFTVATYVYVVTLLDTVAFTGKPGVFLWCCCLNFTLRLVNFFFSMTLSANVAVDAVLPLRYSPYLILLDLLFLPAVGGAPGPAYPRRRVQAGRLAQPHILAGTHKVSDDAITLVIPFRCKIVMSL